MFHPSNLSYAPRSCNPRMHLLLPLTVFLSGQTGRLLYFSKWTVFSFYFPALYFVTKGCSFFPFVVVLTSLISLEKISSYSEWNKKQQVLIQHKSWLFILKHLSLNKKTIALPTTALELKYHRIISPHQDMLCWSLRLRSLPSLSAVGVSCVCVICPLRVYIICIFKMTVEHISHL